MPQVQIQYKTLKIFDNEIDQYFKKISKFFLGGKLITKQLLMRFNRNSEFKKNIGKIKFFLIFNCYLNSLFQDFNQEKSTKISILMPPVQIKYKTL